MASHPHPVFNSIEQYLLYFATIKRRNYNTNTVNTSTFPVINSSNYITSTTGPSTGAVSAVETGPSTGVVSPVETGPSTGVVSPVETGPSTGVVSPVESVPSTGTDSPVSTGPSTGTITRDIVEDNIIVNVDVELIDDNTTNITFTWSNGDTKTVQLQSTNDLTARVDKLEQTVEGHTESINAVVNTLAEIGVRITKIEQLI